MSTFIVRIELHPSDKEQDSSAVHTSMEKSGFSRIHRASDGVSYHLPSSEYCMTAPGSAQSILELARNAAGKAATRFMLLVSETTAIAVAGLVPVGQPVLPVPQTAPLAGRITAPRAA